MSKLITTKKINDTIEKIEKRLRKVETKPFQVIYDKELSSYIIKTTNKVIHPALVGSFLQGLNLWIGSVIVNDAGFLNLELKEC